MQSDHEHDKSDSTERYSTFVTAHGSLLYPSASRVQLLGGPFELESTRHATPTLPKLAVHFSISHYDVVCRPHAYRLLFKES